MSTIKNDRATNTSPAVRLAAALAAVDAVLAGGRGSDRKVREALREAGVAADAGREAAEALSFAVRGGATRRALVAAAEAAVERRAGELAVLKDGPEVAALVDAGVRPAAARWVAVALAGAFTSSHRGR